MFKEVRYLEWLLPEMDTVHKTIPQTIRNHAKEAFARYPIAMALQVALTGYNQAKASMNSTNTSLLISHIVAVREIVKEAIGGSKRTKRWIKWDSPDLTDWVGQLSSRVYTLQERVDDLNDKLTRIDSALLELSTCQYDRKVMSDLLERVQVIVDDMQTRGYSNVLAWVYELDKKIETIIVSRLQVAIQLWAKSFELGVASSSDVAQYLQQIQQDAQSSKVPTTTVDIDWSKLPLLDQTVHEVLISNQLLYVYPPLDQARVEWIGTFHQYIGIASTLPRIVSSRFHVFSKTTGQPRDYSDALHSISPVILRHVFDTMETKLTTASEYVQQWLQYQTLWDASVTEIADKLGKDIQKWSQLLVEIKLSRRTIETEEEEQVYNLSTHIHLIYRQCIYVFSIYFICDAYLLFHILIISQCIYIHRIHVYRALVQWSSTTARSRTRSTSSTTSGRRSPNSASVCYC